MEPARPLKHSSGTPIAGGGEPPYDGGMEHRMTALETRFDTILPTLATKADVEILRAELADFRAESRAEIEGVRLASKSDVELLRAKIDGFRDEAKADAKLLRVEMAALRFELKADIDALRVSMNADSAAIRAELENTALRLEVKFHELRADMHEMHASIKTWMLGTVISMTGIMLAAVVAISQVHRITTPVAAAQPAPNVVPASPR
ncbi:coiled-coil domain-containing protein [Massilia sp. TWR1-2-2]|uniref:coiled-coil domain-containing protein n=1 Tax=Massilia sp. TWR1-2-2 TaxID=2804584 RepID=UPI003CEC684B